MRRPRPPLVLLVGLLAAAGPMSGPPPDRMDGVSEFPLRQSPGLSCAPGATVPPALSSADPAAALSAAARLPVREGRMRRQAALCRDLAVRDPRSAVELAASLGLDEGEDDPVSALVLDWALRDPVPALAWVMASPDPGRRARCLLPFVTLLAASAPREAAELVAEAMPEGSVRAGATLALVATWAAHDPDASLDWIACLPDHDLRAAAIGIVARTSPAPSTTDLALSDSPRR